MRIHRPLAAALAAITFAATAASSQTVTWSWQSHRRAWLGFSYDIVRDDRGREQTRAAVLEVIPDSPAESAGLQVGDTILSINGINASRQLISSLGSSLEPGDDVRVAIRRNGADRALTITAAEPRDEPFGPMVMRFDGDSIRSLMRVLVDSAFAGLDTTRGFSYFFADSLRGELDSLRTRILSVPRIRVEAFPDSMFRGGAFVFTPGDTVVGSWSFGGNTPFSFSMVGRAAIAGAELTRLDPGMREYFGVSEGVLVTRVPRDTPAERAGLRAGDVIVGVNGESVDTVQELRREIQQNRGDGVRLDVVRRNQRITVELDGG